MSKLVSPSLVNSPRVIQTFRDRKRSENYYLARASLEKVSDLGAKFLDLTTVLLFFNLWRFYYKDRSVFLSKGSEGIFIKQYSRFDECYRDKIKRKMKPLNKVIFDVKFEFTLDPKSFFSLLYEFIFIVKAWNKLRSYLIKKYGEFDYLRVLETQKKGRPHLHVLVCFHDFKVKNQFFRGSAKFYKTVYSDTRQMWTKYGGGHIWVKKLHNRNRVKMVSYVLKYVNKTLRKDDPQLSALLFASNRRLFGLSDDLQDLQGLRKRDPQGYIYEGSIPTWKIQRFCKDHDLEYADVLIIDFSKFAEDPPDFLGERFE